jgi:transposase
MPSMSPAARIFVALESVDMLNSFIGLSAAVETVLAQDVASGRLFLFTSRLRTRVKALYWDGNGLVSYTKRLEHCRFGWCGFRKF